MLYVDENTPIEGIYRLAEGIFLNARDEARGAMMQWAHKKPKEIEEIQLEAVEYANDWLEFFAQRLPPSAGEIQPITYTPYSPPPKPANANKPRLGKTRLRIIEYLQTSQQGTVYEIAEAIGSSVASVYDVMRHRPDLFQVVGYTRTEHDIKIRVWALKESNQ